MIKNNRNIYSVLEIEKTSEGANYLIEIDFSQPIFQGHFPNKAVLPGVIMCDIIRYQASELLEKKLYLYSAKNIKFSRMIIPSNDNKYNIKLISYKKHNQYDIKATISKNDEIYFKINAKYQEKT